VSANLVKMMNYPKLSPDEPNSYSGRYGAREYLRDTVQSGPTPFKWLRITLPWSFVQPNPPPYAPTDAGAAFDFYNTDGQAQVWLNWLDEAIAEANADGIFVNLCLGQYYPGWVTPNSPAVEPASASQPRPKPRSQRLPGDVSASSYWSKWVTYLYNRYHAVNYQGVYNPVGPRAAGQWWGNPRSAWIGAFEFCNEPNLYSWNATDPAHCVIANMFQAVDGILNFWGAACGVIGPATADIGNSYYANGQQNGVAYDAFTNNVLDLLQNWRPSNYVAWSHHNYGDMRESRDSPDTATLTRIKKVGTALGTKNWRGGGDRNIWVTEGGYRLPDVFVPIEETRQVNAIASTWKALKGYSNAVSFAQYLLHNEPRDDYWSGLTDVGFYDIANEYHPGAHLPSWTTFANRT
jgi:hypothetical protein